MRIVIVGPAHPYRGGIADTNESLLKSLLEAGHDASIVTFTVQYPNFLFPGKTQFTTDVAPKGVSIKRAINTINPFNWIRVARMLNKQSPDLVIVRYWLPFLAPSLGTITRLLKKKTVSIAMCDNVIPHEKRIGDHFLTRYFTNAFHGFITLSRTTQKELDLFTKKTKTYYPHPINSNLGEKVERERAREYLGLDRDGKYLLFFGLIRDYKGLDLTLKALGVACIKEQGVKLLVVGEFYESPDRYLNLIDELGLKDHVVIVDKFIDTAEIKYYFSAVDMVIQTYKTASQSGVSQIAFNFDCPILVTNVGGLSEIILHDKVGYVAEKDPEEIAKYILDFFVRERGEEFAKNILLEKPKYSWKTFADKVVSLHHDLKE